VSGSGGDEGEEGGGGDNSAAKDGEDLHCWKE
jgi:hypothetical protein